jgi:hypothetical protein
VSSTVAGTCLHIIYDINNCQHTPATLTLMWDLLKLTFLAVLELDVLAHEFLGDSD